MSIASLHCPRPIRRRHAFAPRDHARRDRAIELFEASQYPQAVRETLAYLLPDTAIPDLTSVPLCLVQGSARVRAHIEDGAMLFTTALAELRPEANATAALRFFLTRISATGQMYQPRLRGDVIALEYGDKLSLLHPLKLIEVLQRMAMEAYSSDSWMVDRFGVQTPDREPVTPLDAVEFARAQGIWNAHWAAVDELMTESRRRRSVALLDALGSYAANQVHYTLPLFGTLRENLHEAADDFTDKDENPTKRESTLGKCIKEMRSATSEDLRRCLGHATYAINPLREGTPSLLTSMLGGGARMQGAGELRAAGRFLEAALVLISDYLYLLAHYSWSAQVETALQAGLDTVSGRPWREAADGLWNHANNTARIFGNHGEHDRDDDDADAAAAPRHDG